MKKCKNPQDGDLPERNDREASCRNKMPKKLLYKRLRKLKLKKNRAQPSTPHNTTQYIMEQHPLFAFEYEELLGMVLGHRLQYKA